MSAFAYIITQHEAYRGNAVRNGVRRAKLMPESMAEPNCRVILHTHWPQTHPARKLQLLANSDVLRIGLRLREIPEQVVQGLVHQRLQGRYDLWAIQILHGVIHGTHTSREPVGLLG